MIFFFIYLFFFIVKCLNTKIELSLKSSVSFYLFFPSEMACISSVILFVSIYKYLWLVFFYSFCMTNQKQFWKEKILLFTIEMIFCPGLGTSDADNRSNEAVFGRKEVSKR